MQDYEKLGVFYLGRRWDPKARKTLAELLLYDSKDLTTHGVCVGMTGSGKTGLCIGLLEEAAIDDPEAFGRANARFHEELVAMAGNQTLTIVAEMLNEVVARAVTIVSQADEDGDSVATRKRGVRSQARLADLVESGDADGAEAHWRTHMGVVGRVMLGQRAKTVIDLLDHF